MILIFTWKSRFSYIYQSTPYVLLGKHMISCDSFSKCHKDAKHYSSRFSGEFYELLENVQDIELLKSMVNHTKLEVSI